MGADYWGPKRQNAATTGTILVALFITSSCIDTSQVKPFDPSNTPQAPHTPHSEHKEQLVAPLAPNSQGQLPQSVTLTILATNAFRSMPPIDFASLRKQSLIDILSQGSKFAPAAEQVLVPPSERYQILAEGAAPHESCRMPSWLESFEGAPHRLTEDQAKPKILKDYLNPSLRKVVEKKKADAHATATAKIKEAKGLAQQIKTFNKVEKIWGMPAIFFITTGFIESKWKTESDNLFMYGLPFFADQLKQSGDEMIETARLSGLNKNEPHTNKPLIDQRTINTMSNAVQAAKKCDEAPVINNAHKDTLTTSALLSEYLQPFLDESLTLMFPEDPIMAELARNGMGYAMINVGAPGILLMLKHPDKPVFTKCIDKKKQAIFGIKVGTDKKRGIYGDTNRSAIMKIIATYAGIEEGVKTALEEHNILPSSYATAAPTVPPLLVYANNQLTVHAIR